MTGTRIQHTGQAEVIPSSDGRITLIAPIQIRRSSGRKRLILPAGDATMPTVANSPPTPIQQALARGHRWLALLESGAVTSLRDIAQQENVDGSYVSRMINLTTLAPDLVSAILDNELPDHLTLLELAVNPPVLWEQQRIQIHPAQ